MADRAYGLKTDGLVKIHDAGDGHTILYVGTLSLPLSLPKDEGQIDRYREDARKVLDKLSKDMNGIGIDRFTAALLYEVLVEHYKGKHNG
jgi:hypothetical protein